MFFKKIIKMFEFEKIYSETIQHILLLLFIYMYISIKG